MERTINANVGGQTFNFSESAYYTLKSYLDNVESRIDPQDRVATMQTVEQRVLDILRSKMATDQVVDTATVEGAITIINSGFNFGDTNNNQNTQTMSSPRRIYRDTDKGMLGGVCSGLAEYLNADVSIVRIIACVLILLMGLSAWVYIIMWILIPNKSISLK